MLRSKGSTPILMMARRTGPLHTVEYFQLATMRILLHDSAMPTVLIFGMCLWKNCSLLLWTVQTSSNLRMSCVDLEDQLTMTCLVTSQINIWESTGVCTRDYASSCFCKSATSQIK